MKCPYCNHSKSSVLESRDSEDTQVTRRRRECLKCHKRFTTYERVEILDLKIVKKNGDLEKFNRQELKNGILTACEKRDIEEKVIDNLLNDIEMKILNRKSNMVSSTDLGKMVLTRLKKIDPVAYLRFTSVFLEFNSLT